MEEGDLDVKTSKYHGAFAQLYRLDLLFQDCHRHARSGNYLAWNNDLDAVWCELAGDLDADCKEEKEYIEFSKNLAQTGPLSISTSSGFNKVDKNAYLILAKQYEILLNKEIWLRRLQNNLGKGTAWSDGSEEDFE